MEILRERGVEFDVINYLEHPLDRATLERLLALLGGDPLQLIRTGDPEYLKAGLDPNVPLDARGVVEMLLKHGHLMQRPVIVRGQRAVIARPAEKVLELLKDE